MAQGVISLLTAMVWPVTTLVIVFMFRSEIRNILLEVPNITRRLLSVKALGAEVTMDVLSRELPKTEDASKQSNLPLVPEPSPRPGELKHGND